MDDNNKKDENIEMNQEEVKHEERQEQPAKKVEVVTEGPKTETKEQAKNRKGLAIAAMVLGIISIVFFCVWYVSITCAVLAIIFGILSLKSTRRGMAIAGISTGAVGFVIMVVFYAFIFFALGLGTYSGLKNVIDYYEDNYNDYNYNYNKYDEHDYYDDYSDWF